LGFMLVFGDLVFIPFTFSIQVYISLKNWYIQIANIYSCRY
jgi:hypothetical protein